MELWFALFVGWGVAGKTVFEFSRPLETCDDGDLPIVQDGTSRVIWSYGEHDPYQNDVNNLQKHKTKGAQLLTFGQRNADPDKLEANTKYVDLLAPNITIPCCEDRITTDATSLYYSMGVDLWNEIPEADENNAVYMTQWDMVFDDRNYEYIHHLVLQKCADLDPEDLDPKNWGESATEEVPPKLRACWYSKLPTAIWTLGNLGQAYPPEVGVKIGGDGLRYMFLELHYNMPHYLKGQEPPELIQDHTGIRLFYTSTPTKYETVDAIAGIQIDPATHVIPAGQKEFKTVAISHPDCVRDVFPEEGEIHIFQAMLHGHAHTKSIKVRHIRDGVELKPIRYDPHYDNYYEQFVNIDVIWKPDDIIMLECIVDSSDSDGPIRGGRPTSSEMCFINMQVYPAFTSDLLWLTSVDQRGEVPGQFFSVCANKTMQYPDFIPYEEKEKCAGVQHMHPIEGDSEARSLDMFDHTKYEHLAILDPSRFGGRDSFKVHYKIDKNKGKIDFGVEAETDGWFGLGFSPNGGMKNSDVVVGWVDDATGKAYLLDMFAPEQALPICDVNQDYFNVKGMQVGVMPYRDMPEPIQQSQTQPNPDSQASQQNQYNGQNQWSQQSQQRSTYDQQNNPSYNDPYSRDYQESQSMYPKEQQDDVIVTSEMAEADSGIGLITMFFIGSAIGVALAVMVLAAIYVKYFRKQGRPAYTVQDPAEAMVMVG